MATLERIRNRAGLLVIVVGLALFAFVIGDFLKSGSTFFNQNKQKVAVVDGESIDIREFQERVEAVTAQYSQNGALQEEQQAQLRESVFEEMVGTLLLNEESEKIGFTVGKDERLDLIQGENISPMIMQIFQNPQTGRFDREQYLNYVRNMESTDLSEVPAEQREQYAKAKAYWENLKKNIITQQKMTKFSSLLSAAVAANNLDAQAAFNESNETVDFNYVFQSFSAIPDSTVQVSDAEITQLYNERKENYKQEKAQVVNYIAAPIVPSRTDFQAVADRLEKAKEKLASTENPAEVVTDNSDRPFVDAYLSFNSLDENQRVFVQTAKTGDIEGPKLADETYNLYKLLGTKTAPDSIKVNLLNLPNIEEKQLTHLADSLINVVKSKTFAEVATEVTGGQGNGDIGWHTELSLVGGLDAKAAATLFDAKLNEPFVLKTTYGSHIVQVTEKTQPVQKYKLATISVAVTPSQETYNKVYNELNQYIAKNNKLASFKDSASAAGYVCRTDVRFTENQASIYPIRNSRQVVRWAFEHKTGDISEIFECDNYFVALAVEGSQKEGYAPLSSVSEVLKREIINRKKGEILVGKLKSGNYSSLDAYAQAMNTEVKEVKYVSFSTPRIMNIGVEPAVNVQATLAEVSRITEPFAGRNGVYVLQITNKSQGAQFNAESQQQQLNRQYQTRVMQLLQSNKLLKAHAKIEDNRIRFY
jgi:peptidyl-prolyl cis-trans isomerase D